MKKRTYSAGGTSGTRWRRWEQFCLQCLHLALQRLRTKRSSHEGENALNVLLFDELRLAARQLRPTGVYPPIRSECPVQPFGVSDESHRRLKATPDITWGYEDDRERDPLKATRDFVIECKRVRTPTASGWVFTVHYVTDGVSRFSDPTKRYAEGVCCAAMVGYLQDGNADTFRAEIDAAAKSVGISELRDPPAGLGLDGIFAYSQTWNRLFHVGRFRLEHRWVDLRQPSRRKWCEVSSGRAR